MSALSSILWALNAPGAYTRGVLGGKPGEELSGRDMLQQWGVLGKNKPGLDLGDIAGFAADMAFDPLNLIPGVAIKNVAKLGRVSRAVSKANEGVAFGNLLRDMALSRKADIGAEVAQRSDLTKQGLRMLSHDKTFDVSKAPEGMKESLQGLLPGLSDQLARDISYGSADDVARAVMAGRGLEGIMPAHPAVDALARLSGTRAYGFPVDKFSDGVRQQLGFILRSRPDVMFVGPQTLPKALGTAAHEGVHSMSAIYPQAFDTLRNTIGSAAVKTNAENYFVDPLDALLFRFSHGQKLFNEEGMAHLVGNAVQRGAAKQSFPLVDYAMGAERPVGDLAGLLRSFDKTVQQPAGAANTLLDFFGGHMARSRALVPVGEATGGSLTRSFAPPSALSTADELLVNAPYQSLQTVPPAPWTWPWVTSAGLYNAQKAAYPLYGVNESR